MTEVVFCAGVRIVGAWDEFETAVQTILSQQMSSKETAKLTEQIITRFGETVLFDGQSKQLFPTPRRLILADLDQIGIPHKKIKAIQAVAGALLNGA